MKQRSSNASSQQEGYVVAIAAGAIVVLLLFVALALNSGNLYLHQLRIQRAADAAALSAVRFIKDVGQPDVRAIAEGVVLDNLNAMQMDPSRATINVSLIDPINNPPVDPNQVDVQVRYDVPMLFAPVVVGFPSSRVTARAHSQFDRVIVNLLLDSSGSMWCAADGDCSCYDPATDLRACAKNAQGVEYRPLRIDQLRLAVQTFVRQLMDPSRDRIAMTIFSGGPSIPGGAYVALPFNINSGFDPNRVDAVLNSMQPLSDTEIGLGLRVAATAYQPLPQTIRGTRAIIMITDGSPIGLRPGEDAVYDGVYNNCKLTNITTTPGSDFDVCLNNWGARGCSPAQHLFAIQEADLIRAAGIQIHGLGFGRRTLIEPNVKQPNYAYQVDVLNGSPWHSYHKFSNSFLGRRIANTNDQERDLDQDGIDDLVDTDQLALFANDCGIPIPGQAGYQTSLRGTYSETYNGQDLAQLLLEIGETLKPKLIG